LVSKAETEGNETALLRAKAVKEENETALLRVKLDEVSARLAEAISERKVQQARNVTLLSQLRAACSQRDTANERLTVSEKLAAMLEKDGDAAQACPPPLFIIIIMFGGTFFGLGRVREGSALGEGGGGAGLCRHAPLEFLH